MIVARVVQFGEKGFQDVLKYRLQFLVPRRELMGGLQQLHPTIGGVVPGVGQDFPTRWFKPVRKVVRSDEVRPTVVDAQFLNPPERLQDRPIPDLRHTPSLPASACCQYAAKRQGAG